MKTELLIQKVSSATSEDKKLIEAVLKTPESLKHSLIQVFEASQKNKQLTGLLGSLIDLAVGANQVSNIPPVLDRDNSFEALVKILTNPEVLAILAPNDPLAAARLKGMQVKQQLLYGDGQPLNSQEVAQLLQISRQAVDKRRSKGKLLGVSLGRRGYLYPVWQFQDCGMLNGLEKVLAQLQEYDPWTQLMFFKTGDIRLDGRTPLEDLQVGKIDAVLTAASGYGKQIAA